ncbi:MAG: hypothetical protein E6J90_01190 [Deltaproteobacteria bacterium]|nr:MAG: hypothetical protein E6J91_31155 [Deltaproteobacteria bacterium]TMQ27990.1 MAG: hypothetical protein E6J90_01190 [Deltaproteobacteria bacterium]
MTGRSTTCAACIAACLASLGCSGASVAHRPPAEPGEASHSILADEDSDKPSYGKAELDRALIAERGAEATLERRVAELEARSDAGPVLDDQLRIAIADLAVRRRFIATLEVCETTGRRCPPRLDDPPWAYDPDPDQPGDPPLASSLRFDLDSWRTIAAELHGRACACRTITCVDSVGVAIDELEPRPMPAVQGDEQAATDVTRARECLFRLRGKAPIRPAVAPAAD